jgi:hypothetical protein
MTGRSRIVPDNIVAVRFSKLVFDVKGVMNLGVQVRVGSWRWFEERKEERRRFLYTHLHRD